MDQAQQIFDEFKDISSIESLVTLGREETLYLEFKTKEGAELEDLGEPDKRNFSEALSEFSNSDGGVLIWGVKTMNEDKGNKPDKAQKFIPIKNVDQFSIKLQSFMKDAVIPMVDNVLFKTIKEPSKESGYLIIKIPTSEKTPHRAQYSKTREYFKRNSLGKYRLEHFDLEDMFGRRQKPKLNLTVTPTDIPDGEGIAKGRKKLTFQIINEGRNIAKYSDTFVQFPSNVKINSSNGFRDITRLNNNVPTFSWSNDNGVIHPNGVWRQLGEIVIELENKKITKINVVLRIACENMIPVKEILEIEII